jgi:hypothetical protein
LSLANESDTFQQPEVDIVCTECYLNALATAVLKLGPGGDFGQAIEGALGAAGDLIKNIGEAAVGWVGTFINTTLVNVFTFDADPITFPPFNVSLDVPIESNLSVSLKFGFEDLELFMQVSTMLAANSSYTIPLFGSSDVEADFVEFDFGVYFTVDLILDVGRPLDMTSGIHLKLDDGILIGIDLFGDKPSDIIM